MSADRYRRLAEEVFREAGVELNGSRPFDVHVHDERFYRRFIAQGTLGLGESYMDGWWDCDQLDEMMNRFSRAKLSRKFKRNPRFILNRLRARLANEGDRKNAAFGVQAHYDIGNDLYEKMLDPRMVYTCAVWENASSLEQAQVHKMELVCRKLGLKPGMKVLDIGCGWGSFARYAAENHGVSVTGLTISREQMKLGQELCKGLPVDFVLQDYREATGSYDRILSIGMFEHVCYKNHRAYMETVHRCLKDDGLTLLHTMGRKDSVVRGNDQWITRYIFPNTQVPSVAQLGEAVEGLFVMEDWENLSVNYEKTLLAWHANFERGWPELREKYGERFHRMWRYYLLIFAGWYRSRALQLWQVVLSKDGIPGGYAWQQERMRLAGPGAKGERA